jgi:hypothetical protein
MSWEFSSPGQLAYTATLLLKMQQHEQSNLLIETEEKSADTGV